MKKNTKKTIKSKVQFARRPFLTLIGMRQGGFTPLIIFGLEFVS